MIAIARTGTPPATLKRRPSSLRARGRYETWIRSSSFLLFFVVAWEIVVRALNVSPLFIVPPSKIFKAFVSLNSEGVIWWHTYVSLMEFAQGFALSAVVGIAFGALLGISKRMRDYLDTWLTALYATPIIAISPLLIMWFGIGPASKVAVVFIVSVFSILISTATGVQSVEKNLLETARSFGTPRLQIFLKVYVPASLPFIISGLRLGLGRGLIGVVVGELFGARAGLGYMITNAAHVFDTATILVGVLIFSVLGVAGTELLKLLEDRITPWRRLSRLE